MGRQKSPVVAVLFVCWIASLVTRATAAQPVVKLEGDPTSGTLSHIGWDTEGGGRATVSLLRSGKAVAVEPGDATLEWREVEGGFDLTVRVPNDPPGKDEQVSLTFPFNPDVSAVSVLPAHVDENQEFHLPVIVSAPGSGPMYVTVDGEGNGVKAKLTGSRKSKTTSPAIDWTIIRRGRDPLTLRFRPLHLPPPRGLKDEQRWNAVRRAWFNVFQVNARWRIPNQPAHAPAGTLANNVISDPVSSCLYIYADLALFTPEPAPGVSLMKLVAHTFDYWVDQRMLPSGEVYGYWDYKDFLDPNPSLLISAWDYVEATGDTKWAADRIGKLEKLAEFMISRDIDQDGLMEAVQSGDAYTLKLPARSCSGHDAVNCGHKDTYSNILAYRAFRCLADVERQLGRPEQQARYVKQAELLKGSMRQQLINPATGWLMMWRSRDGAVHDPAAPWINCLAIQYGLLTPEEGREVLNKLKAKMDAKGFARYDLGLPTNIDPIPRGDYLIGAPGCPEREDGSDTFGWYLNGGVITADGIRYVVACHVAGLEAEGDRVLDLMLQRVGKGDLQSGGYPVNVVGTYPHGGEFFTWKGETCGYEGLLTHCWQFVGAVVLREPAMRQRLYRPLNAR